MADPLHTAYRVADVIREGDAGATLVFDGALPAEPGQFVMAWLPGVEERPFSVVDDDPLTLNVAAVGPFTESLCSVEPGDRVWIRGPYGRPFDLVGERHLLVAGGCGAAGLALLAKRARGLGHQVRVGLGARYAGAMMLRWRFEALGCELVAATDDGSLGFGGTVIDALEGELASGWPSAVYGCGPEPMLKALAARCVHAGLPCWLSMEAVMKCGIGVCGACHHGDRLVCQDGPVFEAGEL
jgi:dihydroorotate dehydrogenase electron transfer subunit